ncbi:alpha/beta hydrolase [Bifidobacterium sp. 64T4]|nr:alpha/beta hydrolase [Bifidobacterium pongonis]MBW3094302.1 alpha/beta hydrolase [Bifidobacterium pongonis]
MAELLVRAHSLYSEAEWKTREAFNEVGQAITKSAPRYASLGMLGLILGGLGASWIAEGKPKPSAASQVTAPLQEAYLSGIGALISGTTYFQGLFAKDEVNQAAGSISKYSGPVKDLAQGNTLTVRKVRSTVDMVGPSTSVAESLENLRRLGEDKYKLGSGLRYATIAVQRYEREDGTNAWLVTIPGTDGHADSPFGWEQNVELMSDDAEQRKRADSARMVVEAMRKAGIRSDEPVALIGHSQGGIVAAQIAADQSDSYNICHVVTAGSPVANHPIPEKTWVTSIEIEDELVAALDGAQNPESEHWLTIRGTVTPTAPQTVEDGVIIPQSNPYAAAPVTNASEGQELSHWLKYHQAAYQNASDLGSQAVEKHERHFAGVISGNLRETLYYEGRMSR